MKALLHTLTVLGIMLTASLASAQNANTTSGPYGVTTIHQTTNQPADDSHATEQALMKKFEIESQTGKIVVTREQYNQLEMARKIANAEERKRYHVVENLHDLLNESH